MSNAQMVPTVTLVNDEGSVAVVNESDAEAWKAAGWKPLAEADAGKRRARKPDAE